MKSGITLVCFSLVLCSCQKKSEEESFARGKEIYLANCISCHQSDGKGVKGVYPSLIKPDYIEENYSRRAIKLIRYGSGSNFGMKPIALSNEEITDVLNYIQNTWGNEASHLTKIDLTRLETNE
ncbi:MAG: cytochrome c [Bacteroidota bacterium]